MSLAVGRIGGLELAGAGSAYPADLDPATHRTTDAAYADLLGADWRAQLDARGWDLERAGDLGVTTRSWCRGTDLDGLSLATCAAETALGRAGVAGAELDLVIVASCTPPTITSSLAGKLANTLGATGAAFDVRAGGASGLEAWITAATYHAQGARTSLVVATEVTSPYLHEGDLANATLFGDGAGALVLRAAPGETGLVDAHLGQRAVAGRPFTVPGPLPPTPDGAYLFQSPGAAYRAGLAEVWSVARDHLGACDVVLPYAVHAQQVRDAVGDADPALAMAHLDAHGCLGCAGPLAALADAWTGGALQNGTTLGSLAVGGGVAWSTLRWVL